MLVHRCLGNADLWWIICDYTDLFFPLELESGTVLRVPSVPRLTNQVNLEAGTLLGSPSTLPETNNLFQLPCQLAPFVGLNAVASVAILLMQPATIRVHSRPLAVDKSGIDLIRK